MAAWLGPHLLPAVAGLGIGWALLWRAARKDRRAWLLARAPRLPVAALSVHDDAWIRGTVRADTPLRCPWFDTACVHYAYRIEREETRTRRRSDGKKETRTEWNTVHSDSRSVPFELDDGGARILVQLPTAELRALRNLPAHYERPTLRHCASVLAVDDTVSVLGVKLDDGSFGPLREVPLLVTHDERTAALRRAGRSSAWSRGVAFVLLFAGGAGSALLASRQRGEVDATEWAAGLGMGLALLTPLWAISTYNRLKREHHQAEAAWRQIDVDLSVRAEVVPQLQTVVARYAAHERELLERLAALRTSAQAPRAQRIAAETDAVATTAKVLALGERYPALGADALFRDLHHKLWGLEEKLTASRSFYNDAATEYNRLVEGLPSGLVARLARQRVRPYFAASTVRDTGAS